MKIKQILEGRAEEIDKQIAALRAEKAALGGGDPDLQSGGEFDPKHDAEGPSGGNMGAAGIMTPTRVPAAGTGASGPPGRNYAPRQVAAGTGADGPAGRYAPKQVAAGTGASGPPGRNYATPKPSNLPNTPPPGTKVAELPNTPPPGTQVASGPNTPPPGYATPKPAQGVRPGLQNQLDSMMKNAGLDRKQAMPNTPPPGILQRPTRIGSGTMDQNWLDKIRQQMEKPIGGDIGGGRNLIGRGTPKRGDDSPEWYNKGNTKTAKPNLLKWMKKNATQPKAFDQDNVNK